MAEKKYKQVTRKDVAEEAGVSVTIVSYVINNNRYVDKEKRIKVEEAIKKLHYKPNSIARALKGKKLNHIVFIADQIVTEHFSLLVSELDKHAYDLGYMISLCSNRNTQQFIDSIISRQYDGVIISSISFDKEYIKQLIAADIPVVLLVNRDYDDIEGAAKIENGLYEGARENVRYLQRKGCKNIIYVDRFSQRKHFSDMSDMRYRGFYEEMKQSGLSEHPEKNFITGCHNEEEVKEKVAEYLKTNKVDAIFGRNDKVALLNSQPTDGGAPCYITLSPSEKFVLTANYMGGSITVFPLDKDGKLKSETRLISFTGNSLDKERQTQPHLHCIKFTPDHKYLLASDLGTDQIHVFPVSENVTDGVSHSLLNESEEFNIKVESGSGPRHICFHPNQKFAYLINEISGKVIAFSYDKGKLNAIQYIEADTVGAKGSGDIHISPDGKFLYASNRLKADGIAIFSINQEEGTLTKTGYQLTGIHPRNFIISRNGRYLLVACRDSNSIQVFERDSQTGLLKDTGKTIKTNKPVCLKFTF